jgi:hypothetical protein
MAELVALWVRLYTRNLPPPVAQRRIDEIDADLHDHIAHERADRTKEPQIALSLAIRMLRGLPADLSWSRTMSKAASRPVARIALVTGVILLIPLLGMLFTNDVNWGVFDFVLAGVLLGGAGLLLHALMTRKAGIVLTAFATAIGLAAIVLGEADDAPGLVGFGCLLIAGTVALAVRTAVRSE